MVGQPANIEASFSIGRLRCAFAFNLFWRRRERPEDTHPPGEGRPTVTMDERRNLLLGLPPPPGRPDPVMREAWRSAPNVAQRAERLLREALTELQIRTLEIDGHFEIVGSLGHRYRIRRGSVRNVDQLDEAGTVVRSLCAAPLDVPVADAMLAQKLLIESDELAFAFLANTYVPDRVADLPDFARQLRVVGADLATMADQAMAAQAGQQRA